MVEGVKIVCCLTNETQTHKKTKRLNTKTFNTKIALSLDDDLTDAHRHTHANAHTVKLSIVISVIIAINLLFLNY